MTGPPSPLAPGAHGGDGARVAAALGVDPATLLDLSASLNPFAPDVAAMAVRHLGSLSAYPDDTAGTEQLAAHLGVDPGRLVLTNGGAEAIALVASVLGSGWVEEPEFSLYRRHLGRLDPTAGRWRSNPSNPTGTLARPDDAAAVWDEAFFPLATGRWTRGDDRSWRLGSLTKLWACPGLRLGYAIAPDEAGARQLRRLRPQWSVNGLALALLPELLAATDLAAWRREIAVLRDQLTAGLRRLGLAVRPSAANWVLIDGVPQLRAALLRHAVLVRDCTSFGLPGTVRVALPPPSQLDRVVAAIGQAVPR